MASELLNSNEEDFFPSDSEIISDDNNYYSNISASKSAELATGCKKPLSLNPLAGILTGGLANINHKKKKKAYEECLANFRRKQMDDNRRAREAQIDAQNAKAS